MSDDSVFAPTRHVIGWDWETGRPVSLPLSCSPPRSVELVGTRLGAQAAFLAETCRSLTRSASRVTYVDIAAALDADLLRWDAYCTEVDGPGAVADVTGGGL